MIETIGTFPVDEKTDVSTIALGEDDDIAGRDGKALNTSYGSSTEMSCK